MGVSVFPAPSAGDNWVQIATNTPTSGTSVTFSSIAQSYSKLMVMVAGSSSSITGGSSSNYFTINGVTSGYSCPVMTIVNAGTLSTQVNNNGMLFNSNIAASANVTGYFVVESANTSTIKRMYGALTCATATAFASWCDNGFQNSSAYVSSITFTLGTGTFSSGLAFTLYGVRA